VLETAVRDETRSLKSADQAGNGDVEASDGRTHARFGPSRSPSIYRPACPGVSHRPRRRLPWL